MNNSAAADLRRNSPQADEILERNGVPRIRTESVSNGIGAIVQRFEKELSERDARERELIADAVIAERQCRALTDKLEKAFGQRDTLAAQTHRLEKALEKAGAVEAKLEAAEQLVRELRQERARAYRCGFDDGNDHDNGPTDINAGLAAYFEEKPL